MNASVVAQGYLSRYFGFRGLREGQGEIINSVLEGRDTLAVMPTGGGKSLCYQLPATMSEGVTLVISPLIALMKDQVDALTARGVPTTLINSSLGFREIKERLAATSEGRFKLIYISPERLRSDAIIQAIRAANIKLLAVDEAHCISHWGHDFRPDYLKIGVASELLGRPQTIALTATATPRVRQDIIDQLRLRDPNVFVAGFDRPNLRLTVRHSGGEKDKLQAVKQILESVPGSGVIYAATRKAVEQLAARLKMSGYDAVPYHGAMPPDERTRVQERFMSGDIRAIVATNAFGMGIDKPDIRFVIHYHIPGSIEAYYQEIGRAGRDGADAGCFLLFNYADTRTQQFFIDAGQPSIDLVTQVYRAIAAIQAEQQNQGDHTVSPEAIASKIGVKPAAIGPALGVLERAGHVERGRRADSTTLVSLLMPVDLALEAVAENSAEGRLLEYLIFETGVSSGEAAEIKPGEVALSLGLSQASAQNRMALLAARGLISCRSAFVGQGVRLLDPEPVATLRVDRTELSARLTAERQKLRKMVDYCYSKACLRRFILGYFGDPSVVQDCGNCSSCVATERDWLRSPTRSGIAAEGALSIDLPEKRSGLPAPGASRQASVRLAMRAAETPETRLDGDRRLIEPDAAARLNPRGFSREDQARNLSCDPRSSGDWSVASGHDDRGVDDPSGLAGGPGVHRPGHLLLGQLLAEPGLEIAGSVLGCVARLNGRFGKGTIAAVLAGAETEEIVKNHLNASPLYGSLGKRSRAEIAACIKALVQAGCIEISKTGYPTLRLTEAGREVMRETA